MSDNDDAFLDDPLPTDNDDHGSLPALVSERSNTARAQVDSRVGRMAAEGVESSVGRTQMYVRRMKGEHPQGHMNVYRRGPAELPDAEKGWMGQIPLSEVEHEDLERYCYARFGGGVYELQAMTEENVRVPDGTQVLRLAGTPKMRTAQGRAWAKEFDDDGGDDDGPRFDLPPPMPPTPGGPSLNDVARLFDVMTAKMAKPDTVMPQVLQMMMSQQQAAEQRAQAIAAAAEARHTQLMRDLAEREERRAERERQERAERDKREAEERERQRAREEREWKQRREDEERRWKAQQEEAQRRHETEIKRMEADKEERLKAMEMQASGGMGMGAMKDHMKSMTSFLMEATTDLAKAKLGITEEEEPPEDWNEAARRVFSKHGGDLLGGISSLLKTAAESKAQQQHYAPPPQQHGPGPRALPAPVPARVNAADDDVDDSPAAPAPQPQQGGAQQPRQPSPEEVGQYVTRRAMLQATMRYQTFVGSLLQEMVSQSDPDAAWDLDVGEGQTLELAFRGLPKPMRDAFVIHGWTGLRQHAPKNCPVTPHVDGALEQHEEAREWMQRFHAANPTLDDYDDDAADDDGGTTPAQEGEEPSTDTE